MANCRTGYKGAVFYMTKRKRGSEPELKLWDSPETTKNIRRTEKQDNWIFYGAKNGRCSMTGITVWSKKRRVRGIARATATCRYAVHPLRSPEPSIRRRAAVQYKAPARRRPVPPAANRKRSCRRRTRLQKELQSIAVYIAALLFLVLAAFAVWKFVSISKNQSTETGAISRITQILEQKSARNRRWKKRS